jgi:hypothetical protein
MEQESHRRLKNLVEIGIFAASLIDEHFSSSVAVDGRLLPAHGARKVWQALGQDKSSKIVW